MDTVGKIITHVSGQLSDQQDSRQFTRWPRQILLDYLNQARIEVFAYRPDAFASDVQRTLSAGAEQKLGTEGSLLSVSVNGRELPSTDIGVYRAFANYATCPPKPRLKYGKLQYIPKSVAIDPARSDTFFVSPPVPLGVVVNATIAIIGNPVLLTLADWDKPLGMQVKYLNNVIDYMMGRAYARDTESQISAAKSQRLLSSFYQIMGVKYKVDSAFNSGYYKGEVGSGDPRASMT